MTERSKCQGLNQDSGAQDSSAQDSGALNPDRYFLLKHIGFDKHVVKAAGHYYFDAAGKEYLDFLAQYGAVPFGHNPPELWEAIYEHGRQKQPSFMQPFLSPGAEKLATRLVQLAPGSMKYATFVNSGAEAVEASIKLARARTGRRGIVSAARGYHGKTLGALSATDNAAYSEPFLLDTSSFYRVPFDDLGALEQRLSQRDIASFLVEAVQGEGGMRVPSQGYLRGAADICRKYGTLFTLDEVQTGLGRTGELFAADAEPGLAPDVILLSKALGGGLVPLGAVLCTEDAWTEDFGFFHSSTFANSHFSCSIGCRVLDLLLGRERALLQHAKSMGDYLQHGLDAVVQRHPRAFLHRTGRGLMQGIVLAPWRGEASYFAAHASHKGQTVPLLAAYLLDAHGIVTAPVLSQNVTLRLQPSLTIERHEVDRVLAALDTAGELISKENFRELFAFVTNRGRRSATPVEIRDYSSDHPPSYQLPLPADSRRGTFAFLIHPTDDDMLFGTLPQHFTEMDSSDQVLWRNWMQSWFARMHDPGIVYHLPAMRSRAGGYAEGWLIGCPLTPVQMLRLRKHEKVALMTAYLDVARTLGVNIVGLGAFTSVISRGGEDLHDACVNLTTGNSLTAIASADSLRAVTAANGRDFSRETAAIIGAAGSIGRLAAMHMAMSTRQLILFGNPANPRSLRDLADTAGEIYRTAAQRALHDHQHGLPELLLDVLGQNRLALLLESRGHSTHREFKAQIEQHLASGGISTPPIVLSVDLQEDLGRASVALSASNAGKAFLDPRLLARDCIVCDVARPLDLLGSVQRQRPDVFAYEGGIMQLPENVAFGAQNVLGYPRGYNLACLSETMVLAMEGVQRSYSLGGTIDYEEALSIYHKSLLHGFSFAVLNGDIHMAMPPGPAQLHAAAKNREAEARFRETPKHACEGTAI